MNKIYENKYGVRIEVIEDNYKMEDGTIYVTWRFADTDRSSCVEKSSFKNMIKANGYKEVK